MKPSEQPVPLYYGINDQHEFWETENTSVLIIRNHGTSVWIALNPCGLGVVGSAETPEDAARFIGGHICTDRVFTGKVGKMRLVPAAGKD